MKLYNCMYCFITIIYRYRKVGFKYSKNLTGTQNSVELVQVSFIKNPGAESSDDVHESMFQFFVKSLIIMFLLCTSALASVTHEPVPVEAFGKYVKQRHGEDNELFSEEYKVCLFNTQALRMFAMFTIIALQEVEPNHSPTSNETRNPNNILKNRYANITACMFSPYNLVHIHNSVVISVVQ